MKYLVNLFRGAGAAGIEEKEVPGMIQPWPRVWTR